MPDERGWRRTEPRSADPGSGGPTTVESPEPRGEATGPAHGRAGVAGSRAGPARRGSAGAREPGSFRDPSGFVFRRDGVLLRQVNRCYAEEFQRLHESGLYDELVGAGLLVPHERVARERALTSGAHAVIRPEPVGFVSYPYEWSFGQLRDAALLTLEVQRRALRHGLRLKDASAYNVQFERGRPLFIDTLSFERHADGEGWPGYRQFCEHFLGPLALVSKLDPDLGLLSRTCLDGVPLPLASRLLPLRTWLRPALLFHVHLHARAQSRAAGSGAADGAKDRRVSRNGLAGVLDSLRSGVRGLEWTPSGTTWADYDGTQSYAGEDLQAKERAVAAMLDRLRPAAAWDLGANDGRFSRLATDRGARTVAFDMDPAAVERGWRRVRETREDLLPLRIDLANPSPSLGWAHRERMSLAERGPADTTLALALVHHLAIGNNLPLERIAGFLASVSRTLVIEWVPGSDRQVRRMLTDRRQERPDYEESGFRRAFERRFAIDEAVAVGTSGRVLYRMTRREGTR